MDKALKQNLKRKIQENIYLPKTLIKKITDLDNNSPDIIYLYYPLLFNSFFKVNPDIVNNISIAGFYYYNSLIILDRIQDGDTAKSAWISILGRDKELTKKAS